MKEDNKKGCHIWHWQKLLMKTCFSLIFIITACFSSFAGETENQSEQTGKASGNVNDKTGLPLPGVTVIIEGQTKGTITNSDGSYIMTGLKQNDVLVFSFVGMKTKKITYTGQSTIDITMEEKTIGIEEVVVSVGYGTQKMKNVTGAIVNVPITKIEDLPVSNLAESLKGQIPGVSISGGSSRPGESATVSIRQTFSFSKDGGSDIPLIVIDDMVQVDPETGKPTLDAFNNLDPSEIENITVLKDGSAAIYGSRASQGAIIVRTKRGKAGKTKFKYSSQIAINDAISHSKTMSAYEFGTFNNRFLKAANKDGDGKKIFSDDELEEMKSLNYDWLDKAWSSATQQKHSLSLSGGTDKATYFAGITYFTQGANLGSQDYDKWNFRVGLEAKVAKNLKLSASVSANTSDKEKSYTKASNGINDSSYGSKARSGTDCADYGYLLHMPKYIPWETTIDGETYYVSPFNRTDRNLGSPNNRTITGWNYFATLNNGSKSITEKFSYNVSAALTYEVPFIKGLSIRGTYARSQTSNHGEQAQLPYTLAVLKNYYSEGNHLATDDSSWNIKNMKTNARVNYTNSSSKSYQANFFANYNRTFGAHDIGAMFSVERSESEYNDSRLSYEGTESDYNGTSETAGELTSNTYSSKGESGTLSYLGRLTYSYQSKYLFQFIFRSDASTKFSPDNYWGFFPAAQFGWVMSEEGWFKEKLPWVDFFKLRYSVGKTGKDNINAWRWSQYYSLYTDKGMQFGSDGGTLGGGIAPKVSPNPDAGWDTTIKHNIGMDIKVLNGRLGIGIDQYIDKTKDMLTNMAGAVGVPISVGGGFAEQNYASVRAWGTEFNINWHDKIGKDISYSVGVHFGFSGNKVLKYPEQSIQHPSANQTIAGRSTIFPTWGFKTWKETSTGDGILRTDKDLQNYWNYLTERATAAGTTPEYLGITKLENMKTGYLAYQDAAGEFNSEDGTQEDPDGKIEKTNDYVKLNKKNKSHGFTTNLRLGYKGLTVSTQISTSWGSFRKIDIVKQNTSSGKCMWAHESYWTDMFDPDDNVDAKYPNLADYSYISANSDFWELNTFRCFVRNLTVKYSIPNSLTSKVNITSASIGVTGNNLWDFYNPYPDHYRNMYDNSYVGYPTLRTWCINLNVTF